METSAPDVSLLYGERIFVGFLLEPRRYDAWIQLVCEE
jgi:hypothetical protein